MPGGNLDFDQIAQRYAIVLHRSKIGHIRRVIFAAFGVEHAAHEVEFREAVMFPEHPAETDSGKDKSENGHRDTGTFIAFGKPCRRDDPQTDQTENGKKDIVSGSLFHRNLALRKDQTVSTEIGSAGNTAAQFSFTHNLPH